MSASIRIAQVKVYPAKGDLSGNLRKLVAVIEELAPQRPDVIITPEGFLDGYVVTEEYVSRDNIAQYAIDPLRSPYARTISQWAADHHAWFIMGCARLAPEGVYNTALIYNRTGELAGMYDKAHLQTHDVKYCPGQRLPVFDSDFGPFGVMICADRRWPETVRTLALQGARVIMNPTYGMHNDKNLRMMQTRSYESEVYIAFTHPGQSLITDPTGEIVANLESETATYAVTEIDLEQVDRVRAGPSAHLRDRRPDLYRV